MESSIYKFIWRYSKPQQLLLVVLTLISFPFLYIALDLPKRIVNQGIQGQNVPDSVFGIPVDQVTYLFVLSAAFLVLVCVNGGFKYLINTKKGQIGERMLRRLRFQLYSHVLRFPLPQFRRMSQGEIITMITAEVEPLGGFIGDAFAQPLFQGGTLLVYVGFIFVQDPILGAAAIALYPLQGYLIPRLQKRVNQLGKQRVRTVRRIADRIGETVAGIEGIHANNTARWHRADIGHRLGDVFAIRFEIYQRKFFIKFLNNFVNQLTPFFFYTIGGYLVIRGDLSFGALVAVLTAYKDMASPWRELLLYYQQKEDVHIKYDQVVENFQPVGLMTAAQHDALPPTAFRLSGSLEVTNLAFGDEDTVKPLDGATCTLPLNRHVAVVDAGSGGTSELTQLLARLLVPAGGSLRLSGHDYTELPESVTGRRIGYVGPQCFVFSGSLRDNLTYGLRHGTATDPMDGIGDAKAAWRRGEALLSGNPLDDPSGDWLDYAAAGTADATALQDRMLAVLEAIDFADDVYHFGLNGTVDPAERPDIADAILAARRGVARRLANQDRSALVERYQADRFNTNANLAENLLFGTPASKRFALESLALQPFITDVLERSGLIRRLIAIGCRLAEIVVDMYANLPPGHEFFERLSFIAADDLPQFQILVQRAAKDGRDSLGPDDRHRVITLALKLVPARHRLGLWNRRVEADVLRARTMVMAELPADLRTDLVFFDDTRYNSAASIIDNILFGKPVVNAAGGSNVDTVLSQAVRDEVVASGLYRRVVEVGLDFDVGIQGARLSAVQKQKVGLVQALLKRPDVLILNRATAAFDAQTQARVLQALRREQTSRGLVWAVQDATMAIAFDDVLVMRSGRTVEHGPVAEAQQPGRALHQLLTQA